MPVNTEPYDYGVSGVTIYAVVRSKTTRQWWNGTAMENYLDAHWATYAVGMAEDGTSGIYEFTAPPTLPANDDYDIFARLRAGGSPVLTDSPLTAISEHWDGTTLTPLGGTGGGGGGADPWVTALPGAYAAGQAGFILGTNLNAAVGAVKTQTDKILFDGSSRVRAASEVLPNPAPTGYGAGAATVYGETGTVGVTFTVVRLDGVSPIPGAAVYVSSDIAGIFRSPATRIADDLGRVRFTLVPGDAYFWVSHPDYPDEFANPYYALVS
jgi:hypothetical protein